MTRFAIPEGGTRFAIPEGGTRFAIPEGGTRFAIPLVRSLISLVALASCLAACGASQKKVEAPTSPPANPQAVGKMVQGVQSAKDASGKDRAIQLLRDAVTGDPTL